MCFLSQLFLACDTDLLKCCAMQVHVVSVVMLMWNRYML